MICKIGRNIFSLTKQVDLNQNEMLNIILVAIPQLNKFTIENARGPIITTVVKAYVSK